MLPFVKTFKAELEKKLKRKIRFSYVNCGRYDEYYYISLLNESEYEKIFSFFAKHPKRKVSGADWHYDGDTGFIQYTKKESIHLCNPAGKTTLALGFAFKA